MEYRAGRAGFQPSFSFALASPEPPGFAGQMVRYRPNVAIILRRESGEILIGERSDIAGAWQFPQGGVDAGETPEEALGREIFEELSLSPSDYRVVERRGPYRYEYPTGLTKNGCGGQEQFYFVADFLGEDAQILSDPSTVEFRAVRWLQPAEFQLEWVAPMKREVYQAVFRDFFAIDLPSVRENA